MGRELAIEQRGRELFEVACRIGVGLRTDATSDEEP